MSYLEKNQISSNEMLQQLLKYSYENLMYVTDLYHARNEKKPTILSSKSLISDFPVAHAYPSISPLARANARCIQVKSDI